MAGDNNGETKENAANPETQERNPEDGIVDVPGQALPAGGGGGAEPAADGKVDEVDAAAAAAAGAVADKPEGDTEVAETTAVKPQQEVKAVVIDNQTPAKDSGSGVQGNTSKAPIILSDLKPAADGNPPTADGRGTPVSVGAPTLIDETRKKIAFFLLGILALVIILQVIFGSIYSVGCWNYGAHKLPSADPCVIADTSMKLMSSSLTPLFTAMVGLVGSVVGFYFGSKSQ